MFLRSKLKEIKKPSKKMVQAYFLLLPQIIQATFGTKTTKSHEINSQLSLFSNIPALYQKYTDISISKLWKMKLKASR